MADDGRGARYRAWMLSSIDRLMAPGVKLPPRAAAWLTQQRQKFYLNERAVPGSGLRDRLRRLLIEAGLLRRPPRIDRSARGLHVPEVPRASAPAGLQGSRTPTPMAPWLLTGQGLPLRPPTRRQAVSP